MQRRRFVTVPTGGTHVHWDSGAAAEAAGELVASAVFGSRERSIENRGPLSEGFPVRRMSSRLEN